MAAEISTDNVIYFISSFKIDIRSMTIARQFFVALSFAFLLVIAFAIGMTHRFSYLSVDGTRLIENLRRTSVLNRELAEGNARQSQELRQQFETVDPLFPERFRASNYSLLEKYTEYLKLDIGEQERLSVDSVKAMQSEWSIISAQIFEQLRLGHRVEASVRLRRLTKLEEQIRNEFDKLNGLQLDKLRAILDSLNRSAGTGFVAVFALAGPFGSGPRFMGITFSSSSLTTAPDSAIQSKLSFPSTPRKKWAREQALASASAMAWSRSIMEKSRRKTGRGEPASLSRSR